MKRGLTGTYHHVSARHLHRYLDEFNFRYNARTVNDAIRNHRSDPSDRREALAVSVTSQAWDFDADLDFDRFGMTGFFEAR